MSGTAPETAMLSDTAPSCSFILIVTVALTAIATSRRIELANPARSTFTLYRPGSNAGKLYNPSAFVTVVRATPVRVLVAVTVAPGNTASA